MDFLESDFLIAILVIANILGIYLIYKVIKNTKKERL